MLEEEKVKKLAMIHGEVDSGSYKSHRRVYSDKYSSNIDCLVDRVISKRYEKQTVCKIVKKRLPIKEIVAIGFVLVMLLALIPQILPPLYGDFDTDVIVSLDPDGVRVNETLFINVTIPSSYNITRVSADMVGVETVDLILIDNSTSLHLWQGVWLVHDIVPDEHIMTITALDDVNVSYSAGTRLSVLPEEIPVDNQSFEPDKNETIISSGLNLTLDSDKSIYFVNETVLIIGVVSFNNSLINTSVDLIITSLGFNLSERLNASDGRFDYQFVPSIVGRYVVQAIISYLNETDEKEIIFEVLPVPVENVTVGLNLSLKSDKLVYVVNETVLISGAVSFNNSLINTSVNLLIVDPVSNYSVELNTSDGKFDYEYVPSVVGSYSIQGIVSYLNETVQEEIIFDVLSVPLKNVSELYIWDDTDYQVKYVGDQITFYANYSSENLSILNANCSISFNVSGWTEPAFMSSGDGFYVYSRSFDMIGTNQFRVWCSAQGYENKSMVSEFVVSKFMSNVSVVSIVDSKKEEHVYALPGTSFYVERTVDGLNGTEAVFTPLFSDGLYVEKIEIIKSDLATGQVLEIVSDVAPQVFTAGKGVSIVERRIDNLRNSLQANVKQLNHVSYSDSFILDGPVTVRVWFRMPSWEEIKSGVVPSSGRISYLTFTGDSFDFEESTWWNANWSFRKLITINSSMVADDLTNFPVLIYEASDSDLATYAQHDGDDIAFVLWSDNTTQLNHEIELFNDTTGEIVAWVNVTSLSSSVDTKIWMYFNNSACSSQENIAGTWDSNYVLIQHLNETAGTFYDSTSYSNDGTAQGDPTYAFSGKVGYAVDLDGTGDAINISDDTSLDFDHNITLEAWVNLDVWEHWINIIFKGDNTAGNSDFQFATVTSGGDLAWDGTLGGGWRTQYFNTEQTTLSWLYLVLVHSQALGQEVEAYRNGSSLGSNSDAGVIYHSTEDLCIGGLYTGGSVSMEIDGRIDEIRISNIRRNDSWINTSYNTTNFPELFLSFASEEVLINTSVDTISPYIVTSSPFTITATNNTPVDNVTLLYRYSSDNSSISWGMIGEARKLTNVDDSWTTLNFWNTYTSPVVVSTYNLASSSNNEAVVRMSNVTSTSCDIRIQNPGDDHSVTAEDVYVIIMEEGAYNLSDGIKVEAYKYEESTTSYKNNWLLGTSQSYSWSYTNPVVLGQVMSQNDTNWSVFWCSDGNQGNPPSNSNLYTCKHVGEDTVTTRNPEIIGYIVIEQGTGTTNGIDYRSALGSDTIEGVANSPPYSYSLGTTYSVGVASKSAEDGGDGGFAVLYSTSPIDTSINLAIDEDTIGDTDRSHTTEQVAYWVFDSEGNITSDEVPIWQIWNNINNPDENSPWSWEFNFPNGTGYYEFYSIGKIAGSNDETPPSNADAICRFNRLPNITDEGPSNGSTNVELVPQMNITVNDSDDETMNIIWYSNSSGSWQVFGTNSSVTNGTYHQTNNNFSDVGTTYWWYVTVNDEVHTNTSDTFHFTTLAVSAPIVITNQSTGVEETNATLQGYLLSNGSLDTTCGFRFGTSSGSYSENFTKGTYASDTEFSNNNGSLTQVQIYFYQAWASNSQGFANGAEIVFLTKPEAPTSLIVQTNDSDNTIYLSWTLGTGTNTTYIERNASGITTWDRGEGILVYNDTGINCEDTGLTDGVTYYYQAWGFANWTYNPTLHQWSDNNATGSNTTNNQPTITLVTPSPNGTTGVSLLPTCQIWANDTNGDTLTVYWYENSTGGYILRNKNSSVSANSTVNYTFTQFNGYGNTYYWKVAANDTKDNVTAWFYFTTTPLDTSVDTISPYVIGSSPFSITATNNTPVDNVTLWYRHSTVNGSWAHYETGVEQNVNGWTVVNLNNTYENPVVIVTGQEGEDISLDIEKSRPMIRNINSNSFEVRVMNDTGAIVTEDVGYIVMEEGHWEIDGVEVEAGTYTVSDAASHAITFTESFPGNTVVIDTIQEETSVSGSSRYTEDSMTSTGYTVYWEGYDDNSNLATVTAGYIAVELGSSSSIFESGIADEVADDPDSATWTSVSFSNSYSITPILFTNPLDTNGGDPAVVGRSNLSTTGVDVRCTEGQNQDSEMDHATDDIPWIVWTETTVNYTYWTAWDNTSNPDTSYPWSWDFDFPNGTGYYQFYSIGNKSGSANETAPSTADGSCRYHINTTIDVTPSQWDIGTTTIGNYNYSTSGFYFNLTNNGNVALNIQIKASNATNATTGASWNLTSTPGFNNYSLQYNKSSGGTWTNINLTYDTFVTNLAIGSWQTFDLNIFMAITSTKSDPLSITVTFRSAAS